MELVIENLNKKYSDKWVLRGANLSIGAGILGLLGANGAGKTTLMRIIATRLQQTSGQVRWLGYDTRTQAKAIRNSLGYLPQDFGLYPELTAREFLYYIANLKGLSREKARQRTAEVLELVELTNEADHKLGGYSGGMKQRVGIAQALLNEPTLLIVDEPTAGLDPEQRARFRSLLATLAVNRLVIFSTHIVGDLEAIATHLALINQGEIKINTSPDNLIRQARGQVWEVTTGIVAAQKLQNDFLTSRMLTSGSEIKLRLVSPMRPHPEAHPVDPTLEEACLMAMHL